MKDQDPFNPAMPGDFKLIADSRATEARQQPPGTSAADPVAGAHKAKRKSTRSEKRSTGPAGARKQKKKCNISWQHLKGKLTAKLGGLEKEKLKTVLVACGIAGAVVLAVVLAVKILPVAVLLLALLGLAGVIRIWDRLRNIPRPV